MAFFKQTFWRTIRNILYRHYGTTKQRFEQANRSLLRSAVPNADPIEQAPQITNRRTDDTWKSLQPVWVLSTGRTGTHTMTELLKLSPEIDAFHEPAPELFQFSYDYHMDELEATPAHQVLMYLRDELVFRSYRDGFLFVETNNRLAYIADLLLQLYPASKFIHVYRNPYDFIRSGMRRKYYHSHMRDYARIHPTPEDPYHSRWQDLSMLEKIAWNWKKVNELCLNFMDSLPDGQKMSFSSEVFFTADTQLITDLFNFTGAGHYHPPTRDVRRVMGQKHNAQEKGQFSRAENWSDQQVKQVDQIIAPTAQKLSYALLSDSTAQ